MQNNFRLSGISICLIGLGPLHCVLSALWVPCYTLIVTMPMITPILPPSRHHSRRACRLSVGSLSSHTAVRHVTVTYFLRDPRPKTPFRVARVCPSHKDAKCVLLSFAGDLFTSFPTRWLTLTCDDQRQLTLKKLPNRIGTSVVGVLNWKKSSSSIFQKKTIVQDQQQKCYPRRCPVSRKREHYHCSIPCANSQS